MPKQSTMPLSINNPKLPNRQVILAGILPDNPRTIQLQTEVSEGPSSAAVGKIHENLIDNQ